MNVTPIMIVSVRPRMRPLRLPCFMQCSAHHTVKLDITRMKVLTPVMTLGSSNGLPSEAIGGQLLPNTPNRIRKYAVKNDAKSMTSEPMKMVMPSTPWLSTDPRETGVGAAGGGVWLTVSVLTLRSRTGGRRLGVEHQVLDRHAARGLPDRVLVGGPALARVGPEQDLVRPVGGQRAAHGLDGVAVDHLALGLDPALDELVDGGPHPADGRAADGVGLVAPGRLAGGRAGRPR